MTKKMIERANDSGTSRPLQMWFCFVSKTTHVVRSLQCSRPAARGSVNIWLEECHLSKYRISKNNLPPLRNKEINMPIWVWFTLLDWTWNSTVFDLVASLSYELNTLRNNICHTCKKKLVSAIAVSAPFDGHGPASSTPASTPLLRRIFQGRQRTRPPSLHTKALPASLEVEVAQSPSTHRPTLPGSKDENIMSPKRESEPLKWSVVYDPQVKRTLDIHLVHEFTYESPVYCAKISPDGQRLAIGLSNVGKTYINELKVKSNIWFVSESLPSRFELTWQIPASSWIVLQRSWIPSAC